MPVRVTKQIKRLCEQIARDFHPEKIILFGSHAYGTRDRTPTLIYSW